ncbi:MAG: hypothetical protein JSS83_04815 [Cyanobacteria bacterium SZAS LIN-3]|nr:hypothetical protein [Cyanobacteria bacterium SZAS LIN-3]
MIYRVASRIALGILCTAAVLTLPCCGVSGKDALKSGITKTINLPAVDAELCPGHVFNQELAFSKLTTPADDNEWHKIPSWMANSWEIDRQKTPIPLDIKNTAEGNKLRTPILAFSVVPPMSYSTGHYTDATGQTWEYAVPPHWQERVDGKYQHHILVLEPQNTAPSPEVYGTFDKRIDFIVDQESKKIVKILQHARQETRYLLEPDPIYNHQNSRTEVNVETFDEHGDRLRSIKSQTYYQSPGRIVADSSLKLPDGRNLFEMFNAYLTKNGMSDRLPKVADVMDKMRYLNTGQTDYSKQKYAADAEKYRSDISKAAAMASMQTTPQGPLSGTIEAQGTSESTSFRITSLKGMKKSGGKEEEFIFEKARYTLRERKLARDQ